MNDNTYICINNLKIVIMKAIIETYEYGILVGTKEINLVDTTSKEVESALADESEVLIF